SRGSSPSTVAPIVSAPRVRNSTRGSPSTSETGASPRTRRFTSASTNGTNAGVAGSAVHAVSSRLPRSRTLPSRTSHGSPLSVASTAAPLPRPDPLPLSQHGERCGHERASPSARRRRDSDRRSHAPHEQSSIVRPQLVGVEHDFAHPPARTERWQRDRYRRSRRRQRATDLTAAYPQRHRRGASLPSRAGRPDDAHGRRAV